MVQSSHSASFSEWQDYFIITNKADTSFGAFFEGLRCKNHLNITRELKTLSA